MEKKTYFSVIEVKQLFIDILEHGPEVCVRVRLIGQMWHDQFVRIVGVTDSRVLVHDEVQNQLSSIEMNRLMQFETDKRFKVVEPYFHYQVTGDFASVGVFQ